MATYTGIDCYPFNVDFFDDDKIALIEGEFGVKGSVIAIRLLCKIYREGCCYQWGNDECLLFARKSGANIVPNTVQEVVNGLVRRSFFDKGVYDKFGILTSKGIQQRYFEAVKRRQKIEVRRELLLVDVSKYPNVHIIEPKATTPAASAAGPATTPAASAVGDKHTKTAKAKTTPCPPDSPPGKAERPAVLPSDKSEPSIAEEIQQMKDSPVWLESVAMRFQMTVEQVKEKLSEFLIDCKARGNNGHSTMQDAQMHFCNWLIIQIDIQNKTQRNNGTNSRYNRESTRKVEQQQRLQEYAAVASAFRQQSVGDIAGSDGSQE